MTPREKFLDFHKKNPAVFRELVKLTRTAYDAGKKKIGIKMLIEVVRWERFIQTTDTDFKINNNYAPYYARAIMKTYPEFDGIFDVRELRS